MPHAGAGALAAPKPDAGAAPNPVDGVAPKVDAGADPKPEVEPKPLPDGADVPKPVGATPKLVLIAGGAPKVVDEEDGAPNGAGFFGACACEPQVLFMLPDPKVVPPPPPKPPGVSAPAVRAGVALKALDPKFDAGAAGTAPHAGAGAAGAPPNVEPCEAGAPNERVGPKPPAPPAMDGAAKLLAPNAEPPEGFGAGVLKPPPSISSKYKSRPTGGRFFH